MDQDGFKLYVNRRERNRKRLNKYIWKAIFSRYNKIKKVNFSFHIIYEYYNKINSSMISWDGEIYGKYRGKMNYRMYKIYRYMLYLNKLHILIDHDKKIRFRFYTDRSDYFQGCDIKIIRYIIYKQKRYPNT